MNSFPIIKNDELLSCFERIVTLYNNDKRKVLDAAERATLGQVNQYTVTTEPDDNQLTIIRGRIRRTADRSGQNLLIKIIEELYDDIILTGAVGVSDSSLLAIIHFNFQDNSQIKYNSQKIWFWIWKISVDENHIEINTGIRDKNYSPSIIVPDYIIQYIQQGIIAYNNIRNAAALALMTIALEGTLRDALDSKGYSYTYGMPSQDVYEITDMNIFPDPSGFRVEFPNPMPLPNTSFLSNAGDPLSLPVRIKRIVRGANTIMEIRNANSLADFWSLNNVVTPGVMSISGLGAAIDISRNHANILTDIDLPSDLDDVIQAVRNNLIHLSNAALQQNVTTSSGVSTLENFIRDKNKVSDTIFTIGETINSIYTKLTNGTL